MENKKIEKNASPDDRVGTVDSGAIIEEVGTVYRGALEAVGGDPGTEANAAPVVMKTEGSQSAKAVEENQDVEVIEVAKEMGIQSQKSARSSRKNRNKPKHQYKLLVAAVATKNKKTATKQRVKKTAAKQPVKTNKMKQAVLAVAAAPNPVAAPDPAPTVTEFLP